MTEHPLVRNHAFGKYAVSPEANQDGGVDWFVQAILRDPETGRLETYSASLTCALQQGTFSHPWERPLPSDILDRLDRLADRLAEAGLY